MSRGNRPHLMSADESERLDIEGLRAENRRLRDDLRASNAETDAAEAKVARVKAVVEGWFLDSSLFDERAEVVEALRVALADGTTCACTGAIGLRVMLGRLTGKSPHDDACPRWQAPVAPHTATVYCAECGGPSDVEAESVEHEDYLGQHVRTLWVRRLDCGHDEVTER